MKTTTLILIGAIATALPGCGLFVTQKQYDTMVDRAAALERSETQSRAEVAALRADLAATRERLDNALKANADNGSELFTSKQRINELAGRVDEIGHGVDETKHDLVATRSEVNTRLDELKKQLPPPRRPLRLRRPRRSSRRTRPRTSRRFAAPRRRATLRRCARSAPST